MFLLRDIHGHQDDPGDAMSLPAYDGEAVHAGQMSFDLAMLVERGPLGVP